MDQLNIMSYSFLRLFGSLYWLTFRPYASYKGPTAKDAKAVTMLYIPANVAICHGASSSPGFSCGSPEQCKFPGVVSESISYLYLPT